MNPFYEIYILSSLIFYGTLSLALVLGVALVGPWIYQQLKYLVGFHRVPSSDRSGLCGYAVRHAGSRTVR